MNEFIARHCPKCKKFSTVLLEVKKDFSCPNCHVNWGRVDSFDNFFDHRCPVCQCRQFYLSKDFNQFIGCSVMLVGVILVPFTFGLSLPIFALFDWLLFRKVKHVINCYKCASEFRGFDQYIFDFKPFLHHIGLKYDKYR